MTLPALDLLMLPLREPERLGSLTPGQWDLLVRQGRRADLLARMAERIDAAGRWADVPPEVARHLRSMQLLARRQHNMDFLESQLATARAELLAVQESTRRVACIAPAYGRTERRAAPALSSFKAAG